LIETNTSLTIAPDVSEIKRKMNEINGEKTFVIQNNYNSNLTITPTITTDTTLECSVSLTHYCCFDKH
jgi:hypothetical protein